MDSSHPMTLLFTHLRFLLAQLHMDSLASKLNVRDIKDTLKSLPISVNDTYTETMARINAQSQELASLGLTVLSWVTCAMRPLSLLELECAIAVRPGDVEFVDDGVTETDVTLSACCGLVYVDRESNIVRLIRKHLYTSNQLDTVIISKSMH
jgi:hypothetical protein